MKKENQNIEEKNCEQKNESKKLENCVNIDWLSLNFKNVQAQDVLEVFCEATKDENLTVSNFIYNDERGFVTGYTHSYSYMGTPYIVISFCPTRPEMGVNLQITGQGCKLIYFQDIQKFLSLISTLTQDYKCNRLDIAYDDFNRVIPVEDMIKRTEQELDTQNGISTIISRIKRDMISIYTNHWNGITSKNLLYGKHRSARSFRLYDKKLEQKVEDIEYWYRLEIELRTKGKSTNADDAFKDFISGKSIFQIFYDNISTIVSFVNDIKIYATNRFQKSYTEFTISTFWLEFLNYLNDSLRIIHSIANTDSDIVIRRNKPTIQNLFRNTYKYFLNQYGFFISLLHSLDPFHFERLIAKLSGKFQLNKKYHVYYENYKNLDYWQRCSMLGIC